jgi:hypothetical protein
MERGALSGGTISFISDFSLAEKGVCDCIKSVTALLFATHPLFHPSPFVEGPGVRTFIDSCVKHN